MLLAFEVDFMSSGLGLRVTMCVGDIMNLAAVPCPIINVRKV